MNLLKDLLEKRLKLIQEGKDILKKVGDEKRNLNEEEKKKYDTILSDALDMGETIKRHQEQQKMEKELESIIVAGEAAGATSRATSASTEKAGVDSKEYRSAMQNYFVRGRQNISEHESRALYQGSSPDGGYLVPREQFLATLLKFIDDQVFIRSKATIFKLDKAQSLGYPSLDTDVSDADWTSEVGSVTEDTAMKFGKRELSPNMLSKLAKISLKLLQSSAVAIDSLVLQRLAYKFAITEEKAFLLGNGAAQPLGLMVASNLGVPTSRDVSSQNTTTAVTMDGLKNCKYSLKGQYQARAAWMFHRTAVLEISKLKGNSNEYIWEPSTKVGDPDILLGAPVGMSEFMPNTFTTGLYVGLFGDFSFYHIAEGMNFSVQRLDELYAVNNQVGFIGRQEVDAMPALAEAFARVKLA